MPPGETTDAVNAIIKLQEEKGSLRGCEMELSVIVMTAIAKFLHDERGESYAQAIVAIVPNVL